MAGYVMMAGATVSAIGEIQQQGAIKKQSESNARVAEDNARITRQQAVQDERKFRVQASKQLGDMRANYAASGIDISQGSPIDIIEESARAMEFDAALIKAGGEMKAKSFEYEAATERYRAKQAETNANMGIASSLLRGASQVGSYNNNYKMKRTS